MQDLYILPPLACISYFALCVYCFANTVLFIVWIIVGLETQKRSALLYSVHYPGVLTIHILLVSITAVFINIH
jgi:hypothetical protein